MKKLSLLLVLVLVLGMFTGCASEISSSEAAPASSAAGTEASTAAPADEPVNLVFWINDGSTQWMDCWNTVRDSYKAAKPNVTIENVGIPWENATTKFNTAAATNTLPDFGHCAGSILSLMLSQDKVVDLQPYFDAYEGKADINPAAIVEAQQKDPNKTGLWQAPMFTSVHQIWYRADWLKEAGYDEFPKTWDEFFEVLPKMTTADHFAFSFRGGPGANSLINYFMLSYTDSTAMFDENGVSIYRSPKAIEGLEKYFDIFRKGNAPQTSISNGYTEMIGEMTTGNAGMAWHHLQSAPLLLDGGLADEQIGYGFIPLNENGRRVKVDGSQGIPMFVDSKEENRQHAWDYLTFLWEPKQQLDIIGIAGGVPVNLKTETDDRFIKAALEHAADPGTVGTTLPEYLPGWSEFINEMVQPDTQAIMMGEKTVEECLLAWADENEKMYKEYYGK